MLRCTTMMPLRAGVSSRAALLMVAVRIASGPALLGWLAPGCGASSAAPDPAAEAGGVESPALPATAAGPGAAPSAEGAADPPPAGVHRGTYFVPVAPELEPYALFELDSVRIERRGDELELRYDLPELLLGEPRGLSFRGSATTAGDYRLAGDDGHATCRRSAGRWRCDEALDGIDRDVEKIDRLLAAMSEGEARARRAVADRFAIDPIGVLEVELSPAP